MLWKAIRSAIILTYIVFSLVVIYYQYYTINDMGETFNMYYALNFMGKYNSNFEAVTGLHYDGTMCILVRDRTWSTVMETCNHEYLHYLDSTKEFNEDCHFKSTEGC